MTDNYKFYGYFKFHFYYRNSITEIDIGGDSSDIYALDLKSEMTSEEILELADNIYPISNIDEKPREKKITILQIIRDSCWICPDKPKLYYAKIDDQVIIYCPQCKNWSSIPSDKRVREIKDEFDYIFLINK